ncbi:MAG: protein tyrosine phosphatase [Planctomycetes bacterium]|nr:protein tyrosine phosphatase [Planctomycetota bacterium]
MSDKQHLLFVCTANRQRSPTAESLFDDDERCEASSCGTHAVSGTECDPSLIKWADVIFCMEERHRQYLLDRFPDADRKRIVVLDIPDIYPRNDPELVMRLREKLQDWV